MQMSLFTRHSHRLAYALPLLLAITLTGCASKNPLMESAPKAAVQTEPAKPATAAPAASQNAPAPSTTKRWLGIFSPYKIDIQQGNFVSQEMAASLKEGMTKEQVRFLLGVPLLTDMFHATRWDYLFRLQKGNGQITNNRLTIHFKDNRVERTESTQLPGEVEYISHITGTQPVAGKPKSPSEAKTETK